MCSGVGKSGSPAPKPMTFSPAAFSALALASTASVADSAMAARRADVRFTGEPSLELRPRASWRGDRGRPATFPQIRWHDLVPGETGRVTTTPTMIEIPRSMLPSDGRFGCGPSKVRPEQALALAQGQQQPARQLAPPGAGEEPRRRRSAPGSPSCSRLPDGWEIVLGNGGSTVFWDVATFGLIERAQPALRVRRVLVEVRRGGAAAPHLDDPVVVRSEPGTHPPIAAACRRGRRRRPHPQRDLDRRGDGPPPARRCRRARRRRRHLGGGRAAVVAEPRSTSTTSPRRSASPATAGCGSPPARPPRRAHRAIKASRSLDAGVARPRHRPRQLAPTRRTTRRRWPRSSCSTSSSSGCSTTAASSGASTAAAGRRRHLYGWAATCGYATPFVADPAQRSAVVGTIDLDESMQRRRRLRGAARQRHRRHRQLPQARPQPAAHRHVPGRRARRRRRCSPAASTTSSRRSPGERRRGPVDPLRRASPR